MARRVTSALSNEVEVAPFSCASSSSKSVDAALRAVGISTGKPRSSRRRTLIPLALLSVCFVQTCRQRAGGQENLASQRVALQGSTASTPASAPGPAASNAGAAARWAPYPPGRWRLVPPGELEPVVIWVSHLLVRHSEVADEESFSFANWHSVEPAPARTRDEALALAREIADRAKRQPEQFGELVRLHSEDITNREHGGSLGGLRASQLANFWPQVLDAFAAIRPGEVSDPVETRFGFHIFLRRPAPVEKTVSGEHIVISHDKVSWARMASCKESLPQRTREEARSLAMQVYQDLKRHPESFPDAVQRYSDDCDVAVGGDFGTWSTREAAPFERRLEVLSSLAPGEIAPPRETHVGFEVIRRTPELPRQPLAADLVTLRFNPWAKASEPSSNASARRKALELAQILKEQPDRFDELRNTYCCADPMVWEGGRELPGLSSILSGLKPGEISVEPLRAPGVYVLARKLDPSRLALPAKLMAKTELPSIDHVPLRSLLGSPSFDAVKHKLSQLARDQAEALALPPAATTKVSAAVDTWVAALEALDLGERAARFDAALQECRALIGDETLFARYRTALEAGMVDLALSQPLPMF